MTIQKASDLLSNLTKTREFSNQPKFSPTETLYKDGFKIHRTFEL